MKPSSVQVVQNLINKAKALQLRDEIDDAIVLYSQVLAIDDGHLVTLEQLANLTLAQKRLPESQRFFKRLIELQPNNEQWNLSLAQVLFHQKDFHQAKKYLFQVLRIEPESVLAQSNLGYILYLLGDLTEAEQFCKKAINLKPDFVDAHCNLGIVYLGMGNFLKAQASLERAIEINSQATLAWLNIAIVFLNLGKISQSIHASRKALQLDPNMVEAYCNLGIALQENMQVQEAIDAYEHALQIRPNHHAARSNLLMCIQYLPQLGSKDLRTAASRYALNMDMMPPQKKGVKENEKMRIGYVSGDFKKHPVGWFILHILSNHDKDMVEVHCYDTAHHCDELTSSLRNEADYWHLIHDLSDQEAAEKIANDEIDILFDLSGHTTGNRLGIFCLKPAAIQISWLGYFASTGIEAIDYIFIGADQAPLGAEAFFTEKIYRLPHCQFCYSPPDYVPAISPPPHLNNGYMTFGSFNNSAKLNHDVLSLWSKLLLQLPSSRLVLKWKSFCDEQFSDKVRSFFLQAGITNDRIELRSASDHQTMFSEYGDIDIALDPFPFSGALTTCEALWMGVPVVTFAQLRPVSRQSAAILRHYALSECIAQTPDEYINVAVDLAKDSARLINQRTAIRQNMSDSMQSDALALTRALEEGLLNISQGK